MVKIYLKCLFYLFCTFSRCANNNNRNKNRFKCRSCSVLFYYFFWSFETKLIVFSVICTCVCVCVGDYMIGAKIEITAHIDRICWLTGWNLSSYHSIEWICFDFYQRKISVFFIFIFGHKKPHAHHTDVANFIFNFFFF